MDASTFDLAQCMQAAAPGAVLSGQLIPLNNIGPLRVTYDWLFSALNCDPGDTSVFNWVISKTGSGATVSLSPQQPYCGLTLYAGVKLYQYNQPFSGLVEKVYWVGVQTPFLNDWLTTVGADEEMTLTDLGFMVIALQGVNGSYLCADGSQTQYGDHSGYLFQSSAGSPGPASKFFLAVTQVHQQGLGIPLASTLDPAAVTAALSSMNATNPQQLVRQALSPAS